jgi:hypothetical protein
MKPRIIWHLVSTTRLHATSLGLLLLALAWLPRLAFATLSFQNGGFELGVNPPPTTYYRSVYAGTPEATDIQGWVVTSGHIDWCGTPWHPRYGVYSAELVGDGTAISQTFDTVSGQLYRVSFSLEPWDSVYTPATIDVTLGGSTYHAVIPAGPGEGTWYDYSVTLAASASSSALTFLNVDAGYHGAFLDGVEVSPIPEPTTMIAGALLLLPFGATALRLSRKNSDAVVFERTVLARGSKSSGTSR